MYTHVTSIITMHILNGYTCVHSKQYVAIFDLLVNIIKDSI